MRGTGEWLSLLESAGESTLQRDVRTNQRQSWWLLEPTAYYRFDRQTVPRKPSRSTAGSESRKFPERWISGTSFEGCVEMHAGPEIPDSLRRSAQHRQSRSSDAGRNVRINLQAAGCRFYLRRFPTAGGGPRQTARASMSKMPSKSHQNGSQDLGGHTRADDRFSSSSSGNRHPEGLRRPFRGMTDVQGRHDHTASEATGMGS